MKHVQCDGGIWRLSERSYQKLLNDLKLGEQSGLDKYGKMVISQFEDIDALAEQVRYEEED